MYKIFKSTFFILIFIVSIFYSCQKDNSIVTHTNEIILNFDTTTFITDLRRDSANFAHLQFSFSLDEKILKIEVIENKNNTIIDLLTDFTDIHLVKFDYPIDITDILQDTTISYTVKVYDTKKQPYSKTFIFNIKPFSIPQIILPDGKNLITDMPIYKIRANLTTGSIPMAKISLTVDGKEQIVIQPENNTTYYSFYHQISLHYFKTYKIKLHVEDINGRQSTRNLTLTKIPKMEKPHKILCTGEKQYEILLEYNEDSQQLASIDFINHYKFILNYGKRNMSELVTQIQQIGYGEKKETIVFDYKYNEQNSLQSITKTQNNISKPQIEKCTYDYTLLKSFSIENKTINNIAYEDLQNLGKSISEIWYTNFPDIQEKHRKKAIEYWTIKIPTYNKCIPNSMFVAHELNIPFQDLFLSPYVHFKSVNYLNNSMITDEYYYTTDQKGRLSTLTRKIHKSENNNKTSTYTYQFIYKDSIL